MRFGLPSLALTHDSWDVTAGLANSSVCYPRHGVEGLRQHVEARLETSAALVQLLTVAPVGPAPVPTSAAGLGRSGRHVVQQLSQRDFVPAVLGSDVQLPATLRHIHQGALLGPLGLSGQSLARQEGGHRTGVSR